MEPSSRQPSTVVREPDLDGSTATSPARAERSRGAASQSAVGSTTVRAGLVAIAAILSCLIALAGPPIGSVLTEPYWQWLRVPVGVVSVLILPGYALCLALFPTFEDLDGLERVGLTTGLSLAQCPLLALLLDRSPWGLSPTAIVLAFGVATCGWCVVAIVRSFATLGSAPAAVRSAEGRHSRSSLRGVAALLGVGVIVLAAGSVYTLLTQPAEPPLTEFYMLGPQGLSQDYPSQASTGQPISVNLAVHNQEGVPVTYRVVATDDNQQTLGEVPPFEVQPGATWTAQLSVTINAYGFGQRIDISLFRASDTQPYRQLSLSIDVPQPGVPTPVRLVATPIPTYVRPEPTLVQNPVVPTPVRIIRTPGAG